MSEVRREDERRVGDMVLLPVRIRRTWVDADAQRKAGDDGRRCTLETPGGLCITARLSDLESRLN